MITIIIPSWFVYSLLVVWGGFLLMAIGGLLALWLLPKDAAQ